MLGFRFAPRIRDLSDLKLYTISKPSNYPKLEDVLQGRIEKTIFILDYISSEDMRRKVEYLKFKKNFDDNLLRHISPLGWEHINFIGDYYFNVRNVPDSYTLRPLNINAQ